MVTEYNILNYLILAFLLMPVISMVGYLSAKEEPKVRNLVMILASFSSIVIYVIILAYLEKHNLKKHLFFEYSLYQEIKLKLQIDYIAKIFIGMVAVLWFVTALYLASYVEINKLKHKVSLILSINLAIFITFVIGMAENAVSMFIGYELLTLATYILVIHFRDEKSFKAGRNYLATLLTSSLMLLLPAVFLFELGLTQNNFIAVICLWLITLGAAKVAVFPFSGWLPEAMVAPTPVSALLHAVAVVKSGAIVIIKLIDKYYGVIKLQELYYEYNAIYVGLLGYLSINILLASIRALHAQEIKKILAYSTIAQLSYIVIAALLPIKDALNVALLVMISHAVAKIGLFLASGIISTLYGAKKLSEITGLASQLKLVTFIIILSYASILGLPPLIGFWAKHELFYSIAQVNIYLIAPFIISSVMTVIYLGRIIVGMFREQDYVTPVVVSRSKFAGASLWLLVIIIATASLVAPIVLF
ncbi:proton-conducting transporter transmembrane domain-containing protein [Rickettsiales endosymbiont of Stachyamoeba lipophora]|uniref:proton-conducting transporter transmembrane domain-containing protein n=1 Tax=Rickettsiales endosymbiont of Stachyamoeba lipophora TaxID=2486578 RepID=UPI000F64624D|nr:proton-conducting transporter membrane subunit [Rickettsiales endosymbiont of Stachyamoeba lipophora]AZL15793.1 hypothetical protein EF513_04440 [Rickettsiales endosymbiont of Stachyamoeba lipophora]